MSSLFLSYSYLPEVRALGAERDLDALCKHVETKWRMKAIALRKEKAFEKIYLTRAVDLGACCIWNRNEIIKSF